MASHRKSKDNGGGGLLREVASVVSDGIEGLARLASSGDDTLNALDLLKAQHKYVERLFEKVSSSSGPTKAAAFNELADMLAVHATIEEKIFYPSVKRASTQELLLESAEEHLAIKRVLADMLAMDPGSEQFDAKLSVLEEHVSHHAKEEEEAKLFPKVRAALDQDYLAALAGEMIALMVDLQQQGAPRHAVPSETEAPAQI